MLHECVACIRKTYTTCDIWCLKYAKKKNLKDIVAAISEEKCQIIQRALIFVKLGLTDFDKKIELKATMYLDNHVKKKNIYM